MPDSLEKISVIMSVYNAERTLRGALDSLLAQTYPNWECVLCDDGSTDSSPAIIEEYRSKYPEKFVILRNADNKHLAFSLNRCLERATGKYIARMDADDLSVPSRLEKQMSYLKSHPGVVLVGTAMQRFHDDGSLGAIDRRVEFPDRFEPRHSNVFNHATILAYKAVFDQLHGYTVLPRTVRGQDRDLWFRFIHAGLRGANMPEALYMVREDRDAIMRRTFKDYWISYQNTLFGYRLLHYPWHWYIKPTAGLLKALVPYPMVQFYRRMQARNRQGAMFSSLKHYLKSLPPLLYLIELRKRWLYRLYERWYDDRTFICRLYRKANHGRLPDLENPKLFTEKLQWLKLYYRHPDIPICSDKVEAKEYVAAHGFPELIIPTIATYDNANDIEQEDLPENFILKASHGSGWNIICRGRKSQIDWRNAKKTMNIWLSENLYRLGREWNYKEQTPKILVEELLESTVLVDYKFMCFNGICRAMQVNHEIDGMKYVDFYSENWERVCDMDTGIAPHSGLVLPKPPHFEKMREIAEALAKPFPFVRVDLYNVSGKIYFGEMTFFPGSGFWTITPGDRDRQFGEWLKVPSVEEPFVQIK